VPFWIWAVGLALFSTLLQIGALWGEIVIDDHYLLKNDALRGCGLNPLDCFRNPQFKLYYRPLFAATFSLGVRFYGVWAFPYHLENLILHALTVGLVVWFFRSFFQRAEPAIFAGLIYAVHPLQVGVTTFIGGRPDTLAMLLLTCFLLGILQSGRSSNPKRKRFWRIFSLLCFTAALFTKEQCLPVLLLLPLLDAIASGRRARLRPWMLTYLIPALIYLALAQRIIPPNAVDMAPWGASLRVEMFGRTLWYYAKVMVSLIHAPLHQSSLGPWDEPQWLVALFGFVCGGIWLAVVARCWSDRRLRFLSLWTTLTLLPVLNLVPVPSQFVAPFRAYFPLFGVAGLVGFALERGIAPGKEAHSRAVREALWFRRAGYATALAAVCMAHIGLTLTDVHIWSNEERILRYAARVDSFLPAPVGLAGLLKARHRFVEALPIYDAWMERLFPGAQTEEEIAARLTDPQIARLIYSLSGMSYPPPSIIGRITRERGYTLYHLGRYEEAIRDFRLALRLYPEDREAQDFLSAALIQTGKYQEAETILQGLIASKPNAGRFARLGLLYVRMQRWVEAVRTLERALTERVAPLGPDDIAQTRALYEQARRYLAP
jgi:tetratricopeptide (TPR) repeat protein